MNSPMQMLLSASNALNKWLKVDLPRLPAEAGKQAGVNTLTSTGGQMCWQLHIIDNAYQSRYKTIIATEANSRFTVFMPADLVFTLEDLTQHLQMQWQYVLAETLQVQRIMPRSDIALLLSNLSELNFEVEWVKNTDRSINGHITDAGLWVTQTLADQKQKQLTPELALDLAIYLNTQPKRANNAKTRFVPLEILLAYCQALIAESVDDRQIEIGSAQASKGDSKVIYLKDFKE